MVCFSHLRWDFVYQRPQHLLSRFAAAGRVFFVEEPVWVDVPEPVLGISRRAGGLHVVTPQLPAGADRSQEAALIEPLVTRLIEQARLDRYLAWYYTPMALAFSRHLHPAVIVYDCMDELSAFQGAPPALVTHEQELLDRADVVFTGGHSLYEAKRNRHPAVHAFPSSIDRAHFGRARAALAEPADQAEFAGPKIGFAGVIDERMDIPLLQGVAERRPDWQLVMIGPVVKIDPASLPQLPNIRYLGQRDYRALPEYMAHWDAAMLPFARNQATRYISPTKTPEYLAAGRPVVSTSIHDVVRPYGDLELVRIADTPDDFVAALALAMDQDRADAERWWRVDRFLADLSWDRTWEAMARQVERARVDRANRRLHRTPPPPAQERRRVALVHNGFPARYHDRREQVVMT